MNETAARHTNRFVTDLLQTMRAAAEAARQDTVAQCQADAEAYVVELRNQTAGQSETLRTGADSDVAAIRERARAEIERIQAETEQRVAARGDQLQRELEEYEKAVEREIEQTHEQVSSYQTEVATFCDRLLVETDPAAFAALAVQMPNPPYFEADGAARVAHELLGQIEAPGEAEPVVEPEQPVEASEPEPVAAEPADEVPVEPVAEPEEPAAEVQAEPEEPAAEVQAEPAEPAAEPAAAQSEPEPVAVEVVPEEEGQFSLAPRLRRPESEPDAQPEPAAAEAAEPVIDTELGEEDIDARLTGGRSASRTPGGESTQVIVVGLVSVASIASFKRQLSRLPGVRSVGVSSGPNGEFIFTAGHAVDTSLGDLITHMPGFQARVVNQRDGVLSVAAHDPETEG